MKYKCTFCNKSFDSRDDFREHVLTDHNGSKEDMKQIMSVIDGIILATDIESDNVEKESFTKENSKKDSI